MDQFPPLVTRADRRPTGGLGPERNEGSRKGGQAQPTQLLARAQRGGTLLGSGADVGREVLSGEGGAGGDEVGRCALEDDQAAVVAGAGAEVDDPVGARHDRLVVLDDGAWVLVMKPRLECDSAPQGPWCNLPKAGRGVSLTPFRGVRLMATPTVRP